MAFKDSKSDDDGREERRYHFRLQLTSWPGNFKKGEEILELARQDHEHSHTLSACAVIIFAATLEQGIFAKLAAAAAFAEEEGDDPKPYAELIMKDTLTSLSDRVSKTPFLLTRGRLNYNRGSSYARLLEQLISFRNWLVHPKDDVMSNLSHKWENDESVILYTKIPKNPWNCVTLKDVRSYRDVVKVYMREVIEPVPDDMQPGEILK